MVESMKMWQGCFSEADFSRMEYIMHNHGHSSQAEALRHALREQQARDSLPTTKTLKSIMQLAKRSAVEQSGGKWQRANASLKTQDEAKEINDSRPKLTKWTLRLSQEDVDIMDMVADRHGLKKRAAAMRFCLHVQACLEGWRSLQAK